MKKLFAIILLALIANCSKEGSSITGSDKDYGTVKGNIYTLGEPTNGVTIAAYPVTISGQMSKVLRTESILTENINGAFRLDLSPGDYELEFRIPNKSQIIKKKRIKIIKNETQICNIEMYDRLSYVYLDSDGDIITLYINYGNYYNEHIVYELLKKHPDSEWQKATSDLYYSYTDTALSTGYHQYRIKIGYASGTWFDSMEVSTNIISLIPVVFNAFINNYESYNVISVAPDINTNKYSLQILRSSDNMNYSPLVTVDAYNNSPISGYSNCYEYIDTTTNSRQMKYQFRLIEKESGDSGAISSSFSARQEYFSGVTFSDSIDYIDIREDNYSNNNNFFTLKSEWILFRGTKSYFMYTDDSYLPIDTIKVTEIKRLVSFKREKGEYYYYLIGRDANSHAKYYAFLDTRDELVYCPRLDVQKKDTLVKISTEYRNKRCLNHPVIIWRNNLMSGKKEILDTLFRNDTIKDIVPYRNRDISFAYEAAALLPENKISNVSTSRLVTFPNKITFMPQIHVCKIAHNKIRIAGFQSDKNYSLFETAPRLIIIKQHIDSVNQQVFIDTQITYGNSFVIERAYNSNEKGTFYFKAIHKLPLYNALSDTFYTDSITLNGKISAPTIYFVNGISLPFVVYSLQNSDYFKISNTLITLREFNGLYDTLRNNYYSPWYYNYLIDTLKFEQADTVFYKSAYIDGNGEIGDWSNQLKLFWVGDNN